MSWFASADERQRRALAVERRRREVEARPVLQHAAQLAGFDLIMRRETWEHLLTRHHLRQALAGVEPSSTSSTGQVPAGELITVRLTGTRVAHLLAVLFEDKLSEAAGPADRAARAIASVLYPRLANAVHQAWPSFGFGSPNPPQAASEVRTIELDVVAAPADRTLTT